MTEALIIIVAVLVGLALMLALPDITLTLPEDGGMDEPDPDPWFDPMLEEDA